MTWRVEYDFDLVYKEPGLSTATIYDLFQQMKQNPALYAEWFARYTVLYSPSKLVFFCVINYPNRDDFERCVAQIPPEFQVPIATPGTRPASVEREDINDD